MRIVVLCSRLLMLGLESVLLGWSGLECGIMDREGVSLSLFGACGDISLRWMIGFYLAFQVSVTMSEGRGWRR